VTHQLGPPLNGLEIQVLHHMHRHKPNRINGIVWSMGGSETPQTVRVVLRELEKLGYVTHSGSGVWRRVATLVEPQT